jgi:hypothetical protein
LDHLQEPHVGKGVPHPHGAPEAHVRGLQELLQHLPLVLEGVLEHLPGIAPARVMAEDRAPGPIEAQRRQEEVQDLLGGAGDGYEVVPGLLEPPGHVARVDVQPPAVGLHLGPGAPS